MRREIELVRQVLRAAEKNGQLRDDATNLSDGTASLTERETFIQTVLRALKRHVQLSA